MNHRPDIVATQNFQRVAALFNERLARRSPADRDREMQANISAAMSETERARAFTALMGFTIERRVINQLKGA